MSDLHQRNTEIMIAEAQRMFEAVGELKLLVEKQDKKIATLTEEVNKLKQAQIMASVKAQMDTTGHGGTDHARNLGIDNGNND